MKNKEYTHYVIVFTEKITSDSFDKKLKQIFSEFWDRHVLNVIVVFWTNKLNCFTYSPFDKPKFLIPLNTNVTNPECIFYDKTINLNGHQLKIAMFNEEERARISYVGKKYIMKGIDGGFGGMVIKKMNATLKLIEPTDGATLGELFPNKSTNGIFALLQNETADMSFNARFFRMQHFQNTIEPTVSLGRDDLCILVPRTGISLNLDNIFDTFESPVWLLIVIVLPIYAFFVHLCSHCKPHSFSHVFLRLFGWNVNQPYMRTPKATMVKIMLGLWITYSAVITNWYNSNLTSYLMVKPRLPDIKTLYQLEQSNYHILTMHKYVSLINEFLINKEHQNLLGRIDFVDAVEISKRVLEKDTSYAYAHKEHILRFMVSKGHLYDTFAQMTECPVPFINVYALAYGSPYKGRVNWILSQSQDCGIIDRWLDMKSHIDKLIQARQQKSTSEHHAITIVHLQSAFYILFFGCIVSSLVFFFEHQLVKYKRK